MVRPALLLHFDDETDQASRIAAAAGMPTACITRHRFPDGELKLRLPERLPPRVALLRSLDPPMKTLWRFCWWPAPRAPWARPSSH